MHCHLKQVLNHQFESLTIGSLKKWHWLHYDELCNLAFQRMSCHSRENRKMNIESNLLKVSSSIIIKKDSMSSQCGALTSSDEYQIYQHFIFLSSSLLECKLPLWNIALVVMGGLALLFAVVGSIETIIDGICVCQRLGPKGELCHSPKQSFTIGQQFCTV